MCGSTSEDTHGQMGAIQARGPRQRRVEGMSYRKATDRKMSRERRGTGMAGSARTADCKHLKVVVLEAE